LEAGGEEKALDVIDRVVDAIRGIEEGQGGFNVFHK
jgi:hypothetical protein